MTAKRLLEIFRESGQKLVIAESITGGLLTAEFAAVAGASDVLLAGVVAYDTELKHQLLGVSNSLLENQGPVDPEVAAQMAEGLRQKIALQKNLPGEKLVALATTGVAGPTTQGGKGIGELYLAISYSSLENPKTLVFAHNLSGERGEIQKTAVSLILSHLLEEFGG